MKTMFICGAYARGVPSSHGNMGNTEKKSQIMTRKKGNRIGYGDSGLTMK
jgi:hypothetical protein